MHSLPVFLRLKDRPVIILGDGDAAEAKRRLIERAGARPVGEDEAGARLAIVAIEDEDTASAAIARLKARGILVNATDRPAQCDFIMPAIIDRDPVLIAVGTGGASAGLAKTLRIAIEERLPSTLGKLAQGMAEARQRIRARWPDAADRRRAIDTALSPGALLDPMSGDASTRIDQWLGNVEQASHGRLETIALRSADPDDLTLREARLLGRADRIVHRRDIPAAILDRARADATRIVGDTAPNDDQEGLTLLMGWKE